MTQLTWYVIYKTTHVETDQFYVGRHQTTNLDDGYQGSGNWVRSFDDTSVLQTEIVEYCENAEHLKEREQHHIDLWFDDELCMNESRDSDGGMTIGSPAHTKLLASFTPERCAAISKRMEGREVTQETKDKISAAWTPARREKNAERTAACNKTPEHIAKVVAGKTGRKASDEARAAMSAAKVGCNWSEKQRSAILASWTPERRTRKSAERKNLVMSQKWCDAIAAGQAGHWVVTVIKTGQETIVQNLNKWARENGCRANHLAQVANGKRKSHKGMTCRKVTKEEYDALLAA